MSMTSVLSSYVVADLTGLLQYVILLFMTVVKWTFVVTEKTRKYIKLYINILKFQLNYEIILI